MPIGEPRRSSASDTTNSIYPYWPTGVPSYPSYGYTYTSSSPTMTDQCSVKCGECGMRYVKAAASAEIAERACDVWLSGHRAAKHEEKR